MPIFASLSSFFSGGQGASSSGSKSPLDEPTLAQAAHNRSRSRGKMALNRQDSDPYTKGRPYNAPLTDDFSSRVSLQVTSASNGAGGPGLTSSDFSRPGSPAAPGSAFLGSDHRSATPPSANGGFSYPPRAPATYSHLADNSPALFGGSPTIYRMSAPHPHAAYPPLQTTWARLRSFLATTYPDLEDSLNLPAPVEVINELELRLNMPLPSSVRESYLCADGQDVDGGLTEGLFFGLSLLPLEDVLSEWTFWRSVEADPATGANPRLLATMGSYPQKFVKRLYACRGWLPLISDRAGNYIGVDLDPGPKGEWGQVIVWGRDFDNKCVLWRGEGEGGWGRWLDGWVTDLENGEGWELEDAGNDSTGSEDDVGYSSYFHDPTSGKSGGALYGDGSGGLRMTGEYRGWPVLEAVWDRSVKQWDAAGLLRAHKDEDEFGVEKRERAEGGGGLGLGVGEVGKKDGLVEVDPASSEAAQDGKRLLVSTLPSTNTGIYPADEQQQQQDDGNANLLSPPSAPSPTVPAPSSGPSHLTTTAARAANNHARTQSNAPEPFDLPTRTDVIAAEAVAAAERRNLRGGWIMSGLLPERSEPASSSAPTAGAGGSHGEYRDVDLEAGPPVPPPKDDADAEADKPPGSGTLSPLGNGVLGFLGRRPSAEGKQQQKLPHELPLPMSLPPTPGSQTQQPPFSAPTSPGPQGEALPPPPARGRSPLSSATAEGGTAPDLGQPVSLPASGPGAAAVAQLETAAAKITLDAPALGGHDGEDDDDGELHDVSLEPAEIDAPKQRRA